MEVPSKDDKRPVAPTRNVLGVLYEEWVPEVYGSVHYAICGQHDMGKVSHSCLAVSSATQVGKIGQDRIILQRDVVGGMVCPNVMYVKMSSELPKKRIRGWEHTRSTYTQHQTITHDISHCELVQQVHFFIC